MIWFTLGHSGQRTILKSAEAAWNYKAGRVMHLKSPAVFFLNIISIIIHLLTSYIDVRCVDVVTAAAAYLGYKKWTITVP